MLRYLAFFHSQILHHLDPATLLYLASKFMPVRPAKGKSQMSGRPGCRDMYILEYSDPGIRATEVAEKKYST